ncbi:ATP synthase F0 subunit B [Candidatus Parcubacteria bacterium]|nr:MAG: ATP synthase F0 subunit B [Candidatus Parcubacteria bacterium]
MAELFEAFGINWKLLLVQALNFGVLLLILWKFLYTPVLKLVDERRAKIAEGVKNAEEAEEKLQRSETEGKEIVATASREAEKIVASARERAEEKGSELLRTAETRAEAVLADAQARAEESKRQALKQSEREIARAAMLAAEKVLREKSA